MLPRVSLSLVVNTERSTHLALTITIEDGIVYLHGPGGSMSLEAAEASQTWEIAKELGLSESEAYHRLARARVHADEQLEG